MKKKLVAIMLTVASFTVLAQNDLTSINGKYNAADGLEFENMMKLKKKQKEDIEVIFVGELNGKIENKLTIKWKGGEVNGFLDEKLYNSKKIAWFKSGGENSFIKLEDGVIALANRDGSKIGDVLAKDVSKLKSFDIETANALVSEMMNDVNAGKSQEKLNKMMKFDAFKNNLEKVVFADNKNVLYNAYGEPAEDPKKHIKSQTIGKTIYYNYYSVTNAEAKYGKSAEINIEYEMEGVKKDRKTCSKLGRNWASSIPKVDVRDDHKFLQGRSFCDPASKIFDYAFLSLMNDLNGKLLMGNTYNLKVTVYVFKDGANVATLGKGTIAMKYDVDSQKEMDLWVQWISEM